MKVKLRQWRYDTSLVCVGCLGKIDVRRLMSESGMKEDNIETKVKNAQQKTSRRRVTATSHCFVFSPTIRQRPDLCERRRVRIAPLGFSTLTVWRDKRRVMLQVALHDRCGDHFRTQSSFRAAALLIVSVFKEIVLSQIDKKAIQTNAFREPSYFCVAASDHSLHRFH
ncbi:hypothetical protein EVAR_66651_1 [Eumeta japonica]|uniref:Uncharacterized protein n=1 Tax=Eumeta variegata TaxID=151549 RepID=A0A4C1ZRJ1_EUMVA|nr:hypothetical protein EVAR_66651_1 [Eumeta japonica]